MKRLIVALGLTLAGAGIAAGFATPANATPPAPWVHWKDFPDPAGCNSAGVYFEQQGTIKDFFCDEVEPPSADAGGDTILYVVF